MKKEYENTTITSENIEALFSQVKEDYQNTEIKALYKKLVALRNRACKRDYKTTQTEQYYFNLIVNIVKEMDQWF